MPHRRIRMLIVDDEAGFRETMKERFERKDFDVMAAPDAEIALNLVNDTPFDVALLDIRMPGMDGLALLRHIKDRCPLLEVIMITGEASIKTAIEATKNGAYSYLTKPVRTSELDTALERALEHASLSRDRRLSHQKRARHDGEHLVFSGPEMKALQESAARLARSDATILIEGETGTGKEVLSGFIHNRSPRADGPFVVVDCGVLSESILERELFGHERGAYTGADASQPGLVTVAQGGTLLLDEINHTEPPVQAKLLRLIEKGTFRRLGDPREMKADVRILAATNQNLDECIKKGTFREDLYHRLNVASLRVPPLRERKGDILPLATYFLSKYSPVKERPRTLDEDAKSALLAYRWPGNVRELANVIQRACLVTGEPTIGAADLRIDVDLPQTGGPQSLLEAERRHIVSVLESVQGDKARAAKLLGITVRHLYRKIQKHAIPTSEE